MKNVVIVGASNAGQKVASLLDKKFHVTIIEKQEKLNYNVAMPRGLVDPNYTEKILFKLDKMIKGTVVHGNVKNISKTKVLLENGTEIAFDYLVICSGAAYQGPFKMHYETKQETVNELKKYQQWIEKSDRIVLVGGGTVGIEFSAEIKEFYPKKQVTLIHSSSGLINSSVPDDVRVRIHDKLTALGVQVVLNQRVTNLTEPVQESLVLKTETGQEFPSDLVFSCMGKQTPNSAIAKDVALLNEHQEILVKETLQVQGQGVDHIFSFGDVAATGVAKTVIHLDAFAKVIASNIDQLAKGQLPTNTITRKDEIALVSIGKQDGSGTLGKWTPQFMVDFLARKLKSPDMFIKRAAGFYHHIIE